MKRRDDLTVRDLGSEMILYDRRSETFHVLNDTARAIWLLLDEHASPVSIRDQYASLFPQEDPARLEKDLFRTLDEFGRKGLVETA